MVDSFSVVQSLIPTTMRNFSLLVSKDKGSPPERTFTAAIKDQSGKQKFAISGNVEVYLSEAHFDMLEEIIEALFQKAEDEML